MGEGKGPVAAFLRRSIALLYRTESSAAASALFRCASSALNRIVPSPADSSLLQRASAILRRTGPGVSGSGASALLRRTGGRSSALLRRAGLAACAGVHASAQQHQTWPPPYFITAPPDFTYSHSLLELEQQGEQEQPPSYLEAPVLYIQGHSEQAEPRPYRFHVMFPESFFFLPDEVELGYEAILKEKKRNMKRNRKNRQCSASNL